MLSEKLYLLRRKAGLSQEELAEKLDVSRQAVSKWESGTARPDVDRLQSLAGFYGVTVDALLSDDPLPGPEENADAPAEKPAAPSGGPQGKRPGAALLSLGVILALAGALLLLLRGLLSLLSPPVAEEIAKSSVIHIDGSGILAIGALLLLAAGALLLILSKKR